VKELAVLAAAINAFGFVGFASAAELPMKTPVYGDAPVAVYNWTGWYVGGSIGYGWNTSSDPSMNFIDTSGMGLTGFIARGGIAPVAVDSNGVIGGLHFGYDWKTGTNFVIGVINDFQSSGMKNTGTYFSTPAASAFLGGTATSMLERKLEWLDTVRGKLGWAQQNWLLYATGGLAYGQIKDSLTFNSTTPVQAAGSQSPIEAGWALGTGLEYGWPHWSAGIEYLYVDLGRSSVTETFFGYAGAGGDSVTMSNRNTSQIVRALINYRF